ncbi:peptide deformylase [uncultured Ruminococcus sp.]|uniref:peptide deformylase n=1 Tax=uncultured Ruminococcus sp. TaxID=165186 RepID=UPI0025FAFDEA|nr:peptide deformylase [uncultured Ruminococcus sp.]
MAVRNILNKSDELLHKKCKPVEKFDEKLWTWLDDMRETLAQANGVGLAAPQVAILRRFCIIDVGDGNVYELINPEITWKSEETQYVLEGCLSCPNEWGYVTRPKSVKFKAQDRNGEWYEMEVSDLFAQAVCHETAHLDGHLFTEIIEEYAEVQEQ